MLSVQLTDGYDELMPEHLSELSSEEKDSNVILLTSPNHRSLKDRKWFRVCAGIGAGALILSYPALRTLDYVVARESKVAARVGGQAAGDEFFESLKKNAMDYVNSSEFNKLKQQQLDAAQPQVQDRVMQTLWDIEDGINYDITGDGIEGEPQLQPQPQKKHRISAR